MVIALIFSVFVVAPLARVLRASALYPETKVLIATTALWCALLLLFPWLERAVSRAADRWLFRRPDYRILAQAFARETESIEDERELFALAEQKVQETLGVAVARIIPFVEAKMVCGQIEPALQRRHPGSA